MSDWGEERTHRAVARYRRYVRLKAALAKVAGFGVVVAAVIVSFTHSIIWGLIVLFGGGFAVSLAVLPVMLVVMYAMCGRDGVVVARAVESMH